MENTTLAAFSKLMSVNCYDPVTYTPISCIDRIEQAVREDLRARGFAMDKIYIQTDLWIHSDKMEAEFVISISRNTGELLTTLHGKSVEDLLCDENRALLYLTMHL